MSAGASANAPQKRERIAPRLGLRGMMMFLMELRQRAQFSGPAMDEQRRALVEAGRPDEASALDRQADYALISLDRADAEKLDDIAEVLDWLYLERQRHRKDSR